MGKINPRSAATSLRMMSEPNSAKAGPRLPHPLPAFSSRIARHRANLAQEIFRIRPAAQGSAPAPSFREAELQPRIFTALSRPWRCGCSSLPSVTRFPKYLASRPRSRLSQAITCSDCSPSHVTA